MEVEEMVLVCDMGKLTTVVFLVVYIASGNKLMFFKLQKILDKSSINNFECSRNWEFYNVGLSCFETTVGSAFERQGKQKRHPKQIK